MFKSVCVKASLRVKSVVCVKAPLCKDLSVQKFRCVKVSVCKRVCV